MCSPLLQLFALNTSSAARQLRGFLLPALALAAACCSVSKVNANINNVFYGYGAGNATTTGFQNTAIGFYALSENTTGSFNVASGDYALTNNEKGNHNTANGSWALYNNEGGGGNTATGSRALFNNKSGTANIAIGYQALYNNVTGFYNTGIGYRALYNSTGLNNIGLGLNAGFNLTTGGNNIDIGNNGVAGESAKIRIGTKGTHDGTFIAGISGVAVTGSQVVVNSNGRLGVTASSARFKQAIKPMHNASEAIHQLKPVTFCYKEDIDPSSIPQFGLIAEEVEKVNPDLVVRGEDGKVMSVRYEAVNAMLLNEFLKAHQRALEEHRKVEEQGASIAQLKKQIEALTATVQKVSAQVEMSRPAPQLVANP